MEDRVKKSLTSDQYVSQQIPALLGYQKASVCVNQSDIYMALLRVQQTRRASDHH